MSALETMLIWGVVCPLISFVVLTFFGARLGKPVSGYVACAGMGASMLLGLRVFAEWWGMDGAERLAAGETALANSFDWATLGTIPITIGVNLDSLTVVMFVMVTFVSFWIFVFSLGYMAGHSDEVDGKCMFHRFFTYLSLFGFSMLGLVISNSLLFLFIFWELVGACSYFLIGFYFDKKFASNAAIKAFVTNRVGDFGFIIGLMLVVFYLNDLSISGAAEAFAAQHGLACRQTLRPIHSPPLGEHPQPQQHARAHARACHIPANRLAQSRPEKRQNHKTDQRTNHAPDQHRFHRTH